MKYVNEWPSARGMAIDIAKTAVFFISLAVIAGFSYRLFFDIVMPALHPCVLF